MAIDWDPAKTGPYRIFTRDQWADLRSGSPLDLKAADVATHQGAGEPVSLREVEEVLLPLSRLLNLYVAAARGLAQVQDTFLGQPSITTPFVVALAGSVAVGKSTFARLLCAVLARWPDHPRVDLVTTDGFLFPNSVLEERGLMTRKGFPESYDLRRMIEFLKAVKAGVPEARVPVYSHQAYDVLPDRFDVIRQPDILVFEGLNVLQVPKGVAVAASDFFDFSIYIDADEQDIERWFIQRVLLLQQTAFREPSSFFHHLSTLTPDDAARMAREVWRDINGPNLRDNIAPTRERARLVLTKRADHAVERLALRRL